MLIQYIHAALERAKYEIIDDENPYYGEVPELEGVWATGLLYTVVQVNSSTKSFL